MRIFVAGTDTGVGKTYIAANIIRTLNDAGHPCVGFKPVACGDREDAEVLRRAGAAGVEIDRINPVWLKTPASPFIATRLEKVSPLELEPLCAAYQWLADRFENVVVEGAGGWSTPLAPGLTMASLARALGLPVLLVSANRLGALNHTLLTLESIQAAKMPVLAIILNNLTATKEVATETNTEVLREFIRPVSAHLVAWQSIDLPKSLLCQIGYTMLKNRSFY